MIYKCLVCGEEIKTKGSYYDDNEYFERIFKHEESHKK